MKTKIKQQKKRNTKSFKKNIKKKSISYNEQKNFILIHMNEGVKILKEQPYSNSIKKTILSDMMVSMGLIESSQKKEDLLLGCNMYSYITQYLEDNHYNLITP